jgi:hypothetical protein
MIPANPNGDPNIHVVNDPESGDDVRRGEALLAADSEALNTLAQMEIVGPSESESSGAPMVHMLLGNGQDLTYTAKHVLSREYDAMAAIETEKGDIVDPDTLAYFLLNGRLDLFESATKPVLKDKISKELTSLRIALSQASQAGINSGYARVETTSGILMVKMDDIKESLTRVEMYLGNPPNNIKEDVTNDREVRIIDEKSAVSEMRSVPVESLLQHRKYIEN